MPIKLSDIVNATKKIEVDLGGELLEVEFKTNFYTPSVASRVRSSADPVATQTEVMADAIVSWGFVDDKGKPIPVTIDSLNQLGLPVLNAVFTAIMEAALPNAVKASS